MTEKDFSAFEPTATEKNGDVVPDFGTHDVDGDTLANDPVNGPSFQSPDAEIPHGQYSDPIPPEATHFADAGEVTSVIPANVRELAEQARTRYPEGLPNSAAGATAEYLEGRVAQGGAHKEESPKWHHRES